MEGLGSTLKQQQMSLAITLHLGLLISWSVAIATDNFATPVRFDGDQVFRINVPTQKSFFQIQQMLTEKISLQELDIWRYPDELNRVLDVHIPLQHRDAVTSWLNFNDVTYDVIIKDIQTILDEEHINNKVRIKRNEDEVPNVIGRYSRLTEIYEWIESIVTRHPGMATSMYIGDSYEGLPMKVLKIGFPSDEPKWSIWLDGGIHSREFVAVHSVLYVIDLLLKGYSSGNKLMIDLLADLDWYFLPVINVDGYEYCHTQQRLWRKNRHPFTANCTGVDLNRNFDFHWGGINSSPNVCGSMFRGLWAASEPETQNVANFLLSRKHLFQGFISLHSYGQMWFTCWSYTNNTRPDDHQELMDVSQRSVNAMKQLHGTTYRAGTAHDLMYGFSGGSADWARGVLGVKYSYLLELRDLGKTGFLLPENQSIPVGQEVWEGVKVVAKEIVRKYANVNVPVPIELQPRTYSPQGGNGIFTTFPHKDNEIGDYTTKAGISSSEVGKSSSAECVRLLYVALLINLFYACDFV